MKFKTIQEMIEAKRWTSADPATGTQNYMGSDMSAYFVVVGQNRDSECLTRCNFAEALEQLGGENEDNGVTVGHFGHWACGWYELVLVHEDAPHEILEKALDILNSLDNYPVLDEDRFSQMEYDEACETVENNASEFQNEVLEFIFGESFGIRPAREISMLEFTSAVYHEACSYEGSENAWVDIEAITRLVESKYPPYPELKNNLFYRLAKAKVS